MSAHKAISVPIKDEKHWHQLRSQHVGASDCAALFDDSPYTTKFTLWHEKAGKIASPDFDTERVRWGNRLEPMIAQGLAEDYDLKIRKVRRYLQHPTVKGMGASLDYEILNRPEGPGCLEIKNISIEAWGKNWLKHEDGRIEAPLHIELQLQHQMAVTGWQWGAFGFLVGGNKGELVVRQRHEPTIQAIEKAVADFWTSIHAGETPPINSAEDAAAVIELFSGSKTLAFQTETFKWLVERYKEFNASSKAADEQLEHAKALLIYFLHENDAEVGTGFGYKATYKSQKRGAHQVQASEFRVLRVTNEKGNE